MLTYETHTGIELPWLLLSVPPALIKYKIEGIFSSFSSLLSYLGHEYQFILVWRGQWETHGPGPAVAGLCFDEQMILLVQCKQDINFEHLFLKWRQFVCSLWKQGGWCRWETPHLSSVQNQLVSEGIKLAMLASLPACLNQRQRAAWTTHLNNVETLLVIPLHGIILYFL